ncbi:DUF2203 domain-containing protein [bacterium]|nr:DUF2203 domain-containing protein [bacterium]MCI0605299.1 DUF2203 domain-containing protein [bacterium]
MAERLFTAEEADNLIPSLELIVSNIQEHRKTALILGKELEAIQARIQSGENVVASELMNKRTELEFIIEIIQEGMNQIEELGGQLKDLDMGLVDFPAIIEEEEVLLCWKFGEKSIGFYHGWTDGYAGRKPLKKS